MFNETQDATNIINQMDEKMAPSMSLGGNGGNSVVDLNPTKQKEFEGGGYIEAQGTYNPYKYKQPESKEPEEPRENWGYQHDTGQRKEPEVIPEKESSHGDYKVELETIYKDIESTQDQISILEEYLTKINNKNMSLNDWKDLQKIIDSIPRLNYDGKIIENSKSGINDKLTELRTSLSSLYTREKEILSDKNYDNRTEDQIRADSSTQLKVEDYIKAGLNPAGVSGYYGSAGGGGGSSSSNNEEERKRKKREQELAKQREKERRQDMTMKMLGMLLGTGNALGSAGIRTKGFADSAKIRNQGLVDNSLLKSNISDEAWYDVAEKYIPNLNNTGNIRSKPKKGVAFKEDAWLDDIIKNLK